VGYGDISAASNGERVFCIFLFLCAASLFGTIIAQVNEIVAQLTTKKKDLENILASYVFVKPRLDTNTMFKVREWERFQFAIDYQHQQHKKILERTIPDVLKLSIARKIENNLFSKISFLVGLNEMGEIRTLFTAELLLRSKTRYYSRGSIIADSRENAKGLIVITAGQVGAEIPMDSEDADNANKNDDGRTLLYVFERGDSIGDSAISGDLRWAGSYGVNVDFVARSHCAVEIISIEDIQSVLEKFEFFPIKCRVQRSYENFQRTWKGQQASRGIKPQWNQKVIFYWALVVRHLSRSFDINPDLRVRPPPTQRAVTSEKGNQPIILSDAQENQIKEIFALFDTDGGGSIDRKELEFAMTALGFQSQDADIDRLKGKNSSSSTSNMLDVIAGDGKVTLAEFMALMSGEVLGRNQQEEAQTVFEELCRPDGENRHDNLVTLGKLEAACQKFKVLLSTEDLKLMIEEAAISRCSCNGGGGSHGTVDLETFLSILKYSTW